jgi:anti-anti-sigma factor
MRTRGHGHPSRDVPDDQHFDLSPRRAGDCLHVQLAGDLDMPATFKFEPELDRLLAGNDIRRLLVDLAGVRFVDSAGLGALLSIRERTNTLGIEMSLVNVSDSVQRLLDFTGTGAVFADGTER